MILFADDTVPNSQSDDAAGNRTSLQNLMGNLHFQSNQSSSKESKFIRNDNEKTLGFWFPQCVCWETVHTAHLFTAEDAPADNGLENPRPCLIRVCSGGGEVSTHTSEHACGHSSDFYRRPSFSPSLSSSLFL